MNNIKTYLLFFLALIILVSSYFFMGLKQNTSSPEISFASLSPFGNLYGKVIAASCGFASAGHDVGETVACQTTIICNGASVPKDGHNICASGCTPNNYTCPTCSNNANNFPICTTCDAGQTMQNGVCSNFCQLANACGTLVAGTFNTSGQCIISQPPTCGLTNVCGQNFSGYQCPAGCTANTNGGNINDSCISEFKVSTENVNPNGSVEFSWKIAEVPGVGSNCGFVDLTTPTPRPIPGLQNLSPATDRVRISNIQNSTRFCLVCQFYNLLGNAVLGDQAVHKWVRVIGIGEN